MKKIAFNLLALAGMIAIMQTAVFAEPTSSPTVPQGCPTYKVNSYPGDHHMRGMHRHNEFLAKRLNLTPEQQQQWKKIKTEEMAKMKAIKEESFRQLENILTPAQKTELQKIKKEMQEKISKGFKDGKKNRPCPIEKSPTKQ